MSTSNSNDIVDSLRGSIREDRKASEREQEEEKRKQDKKSKETYENTLNEPGNEKVSRGEELNDSILGAKKSFVEFLQGLLKSDWVKWWLRLFFYFILLCFIWLITVSLSNILYSHEPKKLFIDIWKSSIEFLKLVFAIIGALFVVIKLFINGKI